METSAHVSHDANGNGYGKTVGAWSNRTRLANGKSLHKAAAVAAAWDDCVDGNETIMSNGSSGVFMPSSTDTEFADAESLTTSLSPTSTSQSQLLLKTRVMEALISGIFSTVSSLREAYVHLQSGHAPYNADKIQLADKAVIAELKKLSELKRSYRERLVIIGSCDSHDTDSETGAKNKQQIAPYEGIIDSFHSEIQAKDMTIQSLNDTLMQTMLKNEKLEKRVKRLEQKVSRDAFVNSPRYDALPSPQLLESAVLGASEASRSFAKLLVSLMKMAKWDLDAAANSIEPGLSYVRSTHKKYVFESYIFHRMLNDFENGAFCLPSSGNSKEECFKEFKAMQTMNAREAVVAKPESLFAKYCLKKFVDLIHPKMEESFFGNLEHRKEISTGIHPQSQFYQSFLKLAKAMWLLHQLAFSFEPNARIFQVKRNTEFSPLYMESIVQTPETDEGSQSEVPKVAFTVMPGFRVENTIIKCQVYIIAPSEPKHVLAH